LIAKGLIDLSPRDALIWFCITDDIGLFVKPLGVLLVESIHWLALQLQF
jgi:hypothetical protein